MWMYILCDFFHFFIFILKTVSLFMFFIFYFLQAIKNTVLLAI